jgi:hypothetical protein
MNESIFALVFVLCVCTVESCSTGMPSARGPTTMIGGNDATGPAGAAQPTPEQGSLASACGVRQARRTFVGFSDEQSLADFDLTAR